MGFSEFIGNERVVTALRGMLGAGRVPHAMLFSGPRGVGKFTLARMFAQAANCERAAASPENVTPSLFAPEPPASIAAGLLDDFCGECEACRLTARLADLRPLIERGLVERGARPDAATVERVPLIIQGHPDVWAIVPDPVRAQDPVARPMIRMGQLRAVQRAAYFRPGARRRVFIVDGAETMRPDFANIFLKILEEPPESASLILIAPNPFDLLDTIRSRCLQFHFAPLPVETVESFLKARAEMKPAERRLAAQLSGGSPGVALTLDLEESARLRGAALRLVEAAVAARSMAGVLSQTEQLAKGEKDSFENLLEVFYSIFNDLLELSQGHENCILRNPDLTRELQALSKKADLEKVAGAVRQLDEFHGRIRRNISRQLGLDSLAVTLAGTGENSGRA